ncbi:hypothetical protein EUX98_g1219 [Antrodiella citrinella]|uniref:SET domain-containing protein n=1 Tax=Antrodiella citrinella TaxID=2447956 RepID=A0A4S4N527_9APHY|nr:hypothetical protein EUX98_g1219 [Antrodiella citrinella]
MMATLGIDSDFVQQAMQDPGFIDAFKNIASTYSAGLIDSQATSAASELFGDGAKEQFEHMKAIHMRERSLPPAKAKQIPRSALLAEFKGSRSCMRPKENQVLTRRTYIGTVPGFSTPSLKDLKRISISEMLIRKRHEGRYLLCRIIHQPSRIILSLRTYPFQPLIDHCVGHVVGVDVAVEDPEGHTSRMGIYHYPFTLDCSMDEADFLFPIDAILAIREPYYKLASNGDTPMIRVDAPSDIIFLDRASPLVNNVTWTTGRIPGVPFTPNTAKGWKERGVEQFKQQQWLCAAISFTEGLALDSNHPLLLLNRAEAYLRLGWFNSAARDGEAAMAMNLADSLLERKAFVRTTKAYYALGRYGDVQKMTRLHLRDSEMKALGLKASQRLKEAATAAYDWLAMYKQSQGPASRLDVTSYQGPVEARLPTKGNGPRGLFVTRDVKAGELLVVSKPIASYYPEDNPGKDREIFLSHNFLTSTIGRRSHYALIDRVVQRMWDDPRVARTMDTLYAGDALPATCYPPTGTLLPATYHHPRTSSVDIDIARVEGICSMTVFSVENFANPDGHGEDSLDSAVALYELPSFCNHSCMPSADRTFFGDVMVMRAAQDLKAGEEVTLGYTSWIKPLEERSEITQRKWGFVCKCLLCKADDADDPSDRKFRAKIFNMPKAQSVQEAMKRVAEVRATYADTVERVACGIKPPLVVMYQRLSLACCTASNMDSDWRYALIGLEASMNGLEAAGIVITDRSTSGRLRSAGLPVDTSKPPYLVEVCAPMTIQLAGALDAIGEEARATRWMQVALWRTSTCVLVLSQPY